MGGGNGSEAEVARGKTVREKGAKDSSWNPRNSRLIFCGAVFAV